MTTQRERMLAGELYDPFDPELTELRTRARDLCHDLNQLRESQAEERRQILTELFGQDHSTLWLQAPFWCDYGRNIRIGKNCFFNFGCVFLDVCPITLGDHVLLGPNVHIYAATHPLDAIKRRHQELGKPVTIGSDVWVGGGSIINPGVTIGSRVVIGSGSVVTRDLPDDVLAAGNPCRVIRTLTPEDIPPGS